MRTARRCCTRCSRRFVAASGGPTCSTALHEQHGYRIERIVDLTHFESRGEFLEGTGSLVLDRQRQIAYACLSPRTHVAPLTEFGRALGYEALTFHAVDRAGRPIYHTNVLLAIGTRFAALCTAAIADPAERRAMVDAPRRHGPRARGLELRSARIVRRQSARASRQPRPRHRALRRSVTLASTARAAQARAHGELVVADVATIERIGGGSVRCMLAESRAAERSLTREREDLSIYSWACRKLPPQISSVVQLAGMHEPRVEVRAAVACHLVEHLERRRLRALRVGPRLLDALHRTSDPTARARPASCPHRACPQRSRTGCRPGPGTSRSKRSRGSCDWPPANRPRSHTSRPSRYCVARRTCSR